MILVWKKSYLQRKRISEAFIDSLSPKSDYKNLLKLNKPSNKSLVKFFNAFTINVTYYIKKKPTINHLNGFLGSNIRKKKPKKVFQG